MTWLARNAGLADANVLALAVDPSTPTTLYAGTKSGGLFKSTDGACTWSPSGLSNPTGGQRALPVCQTGPDGVGIACRLDLLVLVVHALRPPEGNRRDDKLLACATAARDRVTEAETLASTNERKASARLRRAIHKVAVFRHVTHRVMRKPDAFWTMFSMADGVLTDLRALQTLGAAQAACR